MANKLLMEKDNNSISKGEDLVFVINDLACIAQGERLDNSNLTIKRILNLIDK